jgi:hypothetical protein
MRFNWLTILRGLIEMVLISITQDFEHQKTNAKHYKIVLTLITVFC